MIYLLDSNAWIGHLRQTSPSVTRRLQQHAATDIVLCAVVVGELLFGAEHSGPSHRTKNLSLVASLRHQYVSLPFDDLAAEKYGSIRNDLANRGTPIGPNDLLIGSIAIAHDLTLVTHNINEFGRIAGLKIEDWQIP